MHKYLLMTALMATLGAFQANAGLIGDSVNGTYFYPDTSTTFSNQGNKLVNPSAVFSFPTGTPNTQVTVGDASILSQFTGSFSSFSAGAFNGFVITDITQNPGIIGTTFSSNIGGFTASRISFTSNSVSVNLQGLVPNADSFISVGLNFGSAQTPEPGSIALMGSSLLGLGVMMMRRRKSAA